MSRRHVQSSAGTQGARVLALALLGNALFSGASGALALAAAPAVAESLGTVPPVLVRLVGGGLLAFAVVAAWQSRSPRPAWVRAIVIADLAWVGGSIGAVAVGGAWLSPDGARLVLLLAAVVAAFVALQTVGLRRARVPAAPVPAPDVVVLWVSAPPADVWRVVGERWGDVHRLLPRVARSRIVDDDAPGVGATRACTLTTPVMGMAEVRERLVVWEPPFGFEYEMLDPPFPFARLRNTWRIAPDGEGSRLTLSPELHLRGGRWAQALRGPVLRALLRELDRDVAQLQAAIEREALASAPAPAAPESHRLT